MKQLTVRDVQIKDLTSGNQQMDITLSIPKSMYITDIYYLIKDIDHVQTVDVEKDSAPYPKTRYTVSRHLAIGRIAKWNL